VDFFARHFAVRRCIALVLAATVTAACATWRTVQAGPEAMIARPPQPVRVELAHGGMRVLYAATLTRAQLVGYGSRGDTASRVTIPFSEVKAIQVRGTEPHGTATGPGPWPTSGPWPVVFGSLAVVGLIALLIAGAASSWSHLGGSFLPIGKL